MQNLLQKIVVLCIFIMVCTFHALFSPLLVKITKILTILLHKMFEILLLCDIFPFLSLFYTLNYFVTLFATCTIRLLTKKSRSRSRVRSDLWTMSNTEQEVVTKRYSMILNTWGRWAIMPYQLPMHLAREVWPALAENLLHRYLFFFSTFSDGWCFMFLYNSLMWCMQYPISPILWLI